MIDLEEVHGRLMNTHIQHPFIDGLEKSLLAHAKSGFRADGSLIFVVKGESGSGKSHVLKRVAKALKDGAQDAVYEEDDTIVQSLAALHFELPSDSTLKAAAAKMQETLGARGRRGETTEDITKAIRSWLQRRKVKLVIKDEVQHLVQREGNRPIVIANAANWIKVLTDDSNIPFVLAGTEALEPILDHDDGQLRTRTVRTKIVPPFDFDDEQQRDDFRGVLYSFEQSMALPGKSNLASVNMAKRIHEASRGYVGRVFKLLHAAASVAYETGEVALNRGNLGVAFHEGASLADQKRNPFTIDDVEKLDTSRASPPFPATAKGGKKPKVTANDMLRF